MHNIVSTRFIECLNYLKENKGIRSYRQFALRTSIHPQALNYILKGERNATVDLIKNAVAVFNFNPMYLYTGAGEKFIKTEEEQEEKTASIVTIVTDKKNREKIVHVPIAAQAGYGGNIENPVFIEELPTFSLPGQEFFSRTQRSFDIVGDSMEPSVTTGDKVICSFVEPECWASNIRTGLVYIVVTQDEVLIKRAENKLKEEGKLILHSDNKIYQPLELNGADIKEIWIVKMKLSHFRQSQENQYSTINRFQEERIVEQERMIQDLKNSLQSLQATQGAIA